MKLRLGDLKKTVTLEQVEQVLLRSLQTHYSDNVHEINLGEAGYVDIECDYEVDIDVEEIMKEILEEADKGSFV